MKGIIMTVVLIATILGAIGWVVSLIRTRHKRKLAETREILELKRDFKEELKD